MLFLLTWSQIVSKQFNRVVKVEIESNFPTSTGESKIDLSALRTVFNVKNDISNFANLGYIEIYNLAESTRNLISEEYQRIKLSVGYGDESGLSVLFDGEIRNVFHRRVDVDIITELYCADGDSYNRRSITKRSSGEDKNLRQIITELISDLKDTKGKSVSIGEINIEADSVKIKGITFCSTTEESLNNLAASYNFNWFIENRKFYAVSANRILEKQVTSIISPQYGMISSPVLTDIGVDVKTLLNPSVRPGRKIKIQSAGTKVALGALYFENVSKTLGEGEYKVLRVTHTGDTRGDEWYSDIETFRDWKSQ